MSDNPSSGRFGMIFDWDGVIVDSARLHTLSWQRMAERRGTRLPEGLTIGGLGVKTELVITDLLKWTREPAEVARLTLEKEALFRSLAREMGLPPQPGLSALLEGLARRNIPCAIGSSAPRANIEAYLDAFSFRPFFRTVVTGDEVPRGKPAPDIFLEAARRLGREPADCVVFEDAPAGVAAARSAGMRVIALLTTHPAEALQADRHITSFEELLDSDPLSWFEPAAV